MFLKMAFKEKKTPSEVFEDDRPSSGEPYEGLLGYTVERQRSISPLLIVPGLSLLCVSFVLNIFLGLRMSQAVDTGQSPYSGLKRDTPVTYHAYTDYWGENKTLATELWDALDIDQVTISVSNSWADTKGLPVTERFPWDHDRGLFYLKGIHDLHCVKMLRRGISNFEKHGTPHVFYHHMYHCLDALRQTVLCTADDTPMRSLPGEDGTFGDGQQLMCRDWSKMIEWAKQPDKEACWKMIDDYKPIKHKLERHAFCPKDSPYYNTMNRYFELHGHEKAFF